MMSFMLVEGFVLTIIFVLVSGDLSPSPVGSSALLVFGIPALNVNIGLGRR